MRRLVRVRAAVVLGAVPVAVVSAGGTVVVAAAAVASAQGVAVFAAALRASMVPVAPKAVFGVAVLLRSDASAELS